MIVLDFSREDQREFLSLMFKDLLLELRESGVAICMHLGDSALAQTNFLIGTIGENSILPMVEITVRGIEISENGGMSYTILVPRHLQKRYVLLA